MALARVVAFTGHRFIPAEVAGQVKAWLRQVIQREVAHDPRVVFLSGGAVGVDRWAAEEVLRVGGRLVIARPYPSHTWSGERAAYAALCNSAERVVVVSPSYSHEAYSRRDRWMVDHSVGVYGVVLRENSGSGRTVRYARETGKGVCLFTGNTPPSKLFTFGYGSRQDNEVLAQLPGVIVDIRLSPYSRWAWSGTTLAKALGPRYLHIPELGNINYKTGGPILLKDQAAGLRSLQKVLEAGPATLLCCCQNLETCHRLVVANLAKKVLGVDVEHLT